jgi:hypothetical protein
MDKLQELLSKTRPYFARYEGTDSKERKSFVEFELGATGGWVYRFGVVGFPASREVVMGVDENKVYYAIVATIENGFRLVADEGTMPMANTDVLDFHSWMRQR